MLYVDPETEQADQPASQTAPGQKKEHKRSVRGTRVIRILTADWTSAGQLGMLLDEIQNNILLLLRGGENDLRRSVEAKTSAENILSS